MSKPQAMRAYDVIEIRGYVTINGEKAPDEFQIIGSEVPLHSYIALPSRCPLCGSELLAFGNFNLSDFDLSDFYYSVDPSGKGYYLWHCHYCRFWQWYYYMDEYGDVNKHWTGEGCPPLPDHEARISKLREFNDSLPSSCSSELAQYLRRRPSEWHRYNPKRFEKLVADIFRANYTNAEVIHVGKPHDGGVDILFVDSVNDQWLVQVKRRQNKDSAEGIETVRNLIGAIVLEGAVRGIIVSTADHFTYPAHQARMRLKDRGYYIKLIDKSILNRMLDPVLPDRPWLDIVAKKDSKIAKLLAERVPSDYQLRLF